MNNADLTVSKNINTKEETYTIPLGYRKMENLHIVFWILKDISWCLIFRPLGILMIFPTLIISIIIAYRTRQIPAELCHNLAITFWIAANSFWMISEFAGIDENIVFGNITFKHLTMIPFLLGVLPLIYYYVYWKPTHKDEPSTL